MDVLLVRFLTSPLKHSNTISEKGNMNMNQNPSPEFALGQIVFLKAEPSTRGAVVAVLPGTPENRINIFANGRIQSFHASSVAD